MKNNYFIVYNIMHRYVLFVILRNVRSDCLCDCVYACVNFKADVPIVNGTRQPDCVWCLHRESAYFSFRPVRRSNPETRCNPIRVLP